MDSGSLGQKGVEMEGYLGLTDLMGEWGPRT